MCIIPELVLVHMYFRINFSMPIKTLLDFNRNCIKLLISLGMTAIFFCWSFQSMNTALLPNYFDVWCLPLAFCNFQETHWHILNDIFPALVIIVIRFLLQARWKARSIGWLLNIELARRIYWVLCDDILLKVFASNFYLRISLFLLDF